METSEAAEYSKFDGKPANRLSRRGDFTLDRNSKWIDVALVTFIVSASLFNGVLVSLTPLIILGTMGLFVLFRAELLPLLLRDNWPLLLLPGFALLSAGWSAEPTTALYYGFLYLVTITAGLMMGRATRAGTLLTAFFIAFAIYTVLSVMTLRFAVWGGEGGAAFIGYARSKNAAGDMAGVGIIATLCFTFFALSKRNLLLVFSALATTPFYLFALWFSRATGALVATILVCACVVAWIASRHLTKQARTAIFLTAIIGAVLLAITQQWWLPPLFEAVLENSGKDAGLTGRSDLWLYADNLISRNPTLGMGYNSFWLHNNLDAEYLWRKMGIASRTGFNFHNTPREILVHLGYVGLSLFSAVAIISSSRLVWKANQNPTHEHIFATAIVVFYGMKLPFEVVAFSPMHFSTLTVLAVLAIGLGRNR